MRKIIKVFNFTFLCEKFLRFYYSGEIPALLYEFYEPPIIYLFGCKEGSGDSETTLKYFIISYIEKNLLKPPRKKGILLVSF